MLPRVYHLNKLTQKVLLQFAWQDYMQIQCKHVIRCNFTLGDANPRKHMMRIAMWCPSHPWRKLKILNFLGKFVWPLTASQRWDSPNATDIPTSWEHTRPNILMLNQTKNNYFCVEKQSGTTRLCRSPDYILNTYTTLLSFPTFWGLPELIQCRNDDFIYHS